MGLGVWIWFFGSGALALAYGLLSWRYYRARGAKLGDENPEGLSWLDAGTTRAWTLWERQTDPDLERLRRRATRTCFACVAFGFLGGLTLPRLLRAPLPEIRLPQIALPALASTDGGSSERWMTVITLGAFTVFWFWWLNVALSKGPDWQSGKPGDPFRFPRNWVIVVCLLGFVGVVFVLGTTWMTTR